ncbi:MAG: UvrD-helicase domain-containing protein [Endomicrobiales bacterium]|nr:UvrD-helicase domain-containing protein [Endomicrobiales bacterium]
MDNFLDQLNEKQREAVLLKDGPLLIFAGAGTGKTRVITYRIAYLLSQGVSPLNILAVTFTNKAAEEMRRRIDVLVPGMGRSVWISTFHSFCAKFLRTEARHVGLDPNFLIYDENDQKQVIKSCIKELNLDEKKFKPARLIEIISRAKDDMLDADSYSIHALTSGDYFRQVVATIYGLYQSKLKQSGALDFGDLLLLTVINLRENKALKEKYQYRFRYIMVDEYQDTNHAQYLLIKYIGAESKNICVVGDDDQSIYSWRGADIRNILEFEKDYPDCRTIKLEQNYRSTSNILSSAWHVIKNNERRVEKKLWTNKEEGNPIKFIENRNAIEESEAVAGEIERLRNKNKYNFCDFSVFYRTNAQSRVLEDSFRRSGIPYIIIGSVRFYERAEIKNVLAYLRLIHNPHDNVSFRRVINIPKRGIGKTTMQALESIASEKGVSLWGALPYIGFAEIASSARKSLFNFKELIKELQKNKENESVKEIALKVLDKTNYVAELEAEDTLEAKNRIENIFELISAIEEFESRSSDRTLTGYLTQVALVNEIDDWTESNDKVVLMTLHLAKGLEFKTVFITGLEEGLFPIGESSYDIDDLEEERRLMYVGMTRAKESLYLSWAQERTVFGKTHWNIPSRFVQETQSMDSIFEVRTAKADAGEEVIEIERKEGVKEYIDEQHQMFALGSRVFHQKFGKGKIIDKSGSGENLKVIVLFDTGQWKKLVVKYANLDII